MKSLTRDLSKTAERLLGEFRVVTIVGARQVGKTTMIRGLIDGMTDARYMSLDSEVVRAAALNDPEGLTANLSGTMAIDEVQRAPELLLAIKTHVDNSNRRGQFLLSGSADLQRIRRIPDTLPGRNAFIRLRGLSESELIAPGKSSPASNSATVIDQLFAGDVPVIDTNDTGLPPLAEALALGSLPEVRLLKSAPPSVFFDSYVDALLGHEVDEIARIDSKRGLRHVLIQIAARTSGLLSMSDIGQSAGISQHTVERYVSTLENLYLIDKLPAWSRNIDQRQVRMPKAHLSDVGLAAHLLGIDPRTTGAALAGSKLGQIFETFVVGEALKANDISAESAESFHYRDRDRHEVDLILERRNGDVVAIEAKASSKVSKSDLRGLTRLRERLGDQLKAAIVVYTGAQTIQFGEGIVAVPVCAFWDRRG